VSRPSRARSRGSGSLDDGGIHTAKQFRDADGVDRAQITEELAPIDQTTFDAALAR